MAKSYQTEVNAEMAADKAVQRLASLFEKPVFTEDDFKLARLAVGMFGAFTRYKQTENARDALQFRMATQLATDNDQLQRYIRVTMPGSPLARELPVPVSGGVAATDKNSIAQ